MLQRTRQGPTNADVGVKTLAQYALAHPLLDYKKFIYQCFRRWYVDCLLEVPAPEQHCVGHHVVDTVHASEHVVVEQGVF